MAQGYYRPGYYHPTVPMFTTGDSQEYIERQTIVLEAFRVMQQKDSYTGSFRFLLKRLQELKELKIDR